MIANLHTHTYRCHHAVGAEREYILRAIEGKYQLLGFSDHTAYPFTGTDYISRIRMDVQELSGYASAINALKAEFADKIDILLGVEAEFYPKFFPELVDRLRENGIEYMILGQHFVNNEFDGTYMGRPFSEGKLLGQYVDQSISAMQTGLYTYFAHPDLPNFHGNAAEYDSQIRRLCHAAAELNVPMEINLLGLREGRHYPNRRFWEIAGEEKVTAVLGSDAHTPKDVWDPITEWKAMTIVQDCGLQLAERVPIIKIQEVPYGTLKAEAGTKNL